MVTGGRTGYLDNYLMITGRARITEAGAHELLHQLARQPLCNVQNDAPTTMATLAEILGFPGFTERECSADNRLYLAFVDKPCERTQEFARDLG